MSESCCVLGRRSDIGAINAGLRAGMSVREVAKTFGVGKSSVGSHRSDCLKLDEVKPGPVKAGREKLAPDAADTADSVRGQLGPSSGATRARLPMDPKDAKTFVEQSLVCADMIATGKWEGRPSVRLLSAIWGLSADAVRDRHQAGTVAAAADRGQLEGERQVAIGALQEQERIALEAFEASKLMLGEEGEQLFQAGDSKFLAIAQKARAEIARIAGCIPQPGTTVNVNVLQSPQFASASAKLIDTVQGTLDAVDDIAQRAAARLGYPVPRSLAEAVLEEAQALLDERITAQRGAAQLPKGEAA